MYARKASVSATMHFCDLKKSLTFQIRLFMASFKLISSFPSNATHSI